MAEAIDLFGADYEHTLALNGAWNGVEIRYRTRPVEEIFMEMISDHAFQACEFSLSNYLMLRDDGADWLSAIPVFPNRNFRHGTLFVRRDSALATPSDLRGARIGVDDYSMTAAVWVRGLLNEDYGVHWREMKWYSNPAKRRFPAPKDVVLTPAADDLESLLVRGELDATISFGPRDERLPPGQRRLRRLFPDVREVEMQYFRRTGIYPISHCVVIRKDYLDAVPRAPLALFQAYAESKAKAYKRRLGTTLVPGGKFYWAEVFESFGGDPVPYGLTEQNRKVIAKLAGYLLEQRLIERLPTIDELFVDGSPGFRE
jgi:4,5-dihydroxyphthalate decarboxylase